MIESAKKVRVKVNRHGQAECEGWATHNVFRDIPNPENPAHPMKGEHLGIGVDLDSGHVIYCQKSHLEVV